MQATQIITPDNILDMIHQIRGEKVLLDFDLAMLYETETRTLKQAVRRNIDRFPGDFMFELTKIEWNELITICDNLRNRKFAPSLPFAFTEPGVAMLSSILKSKQAIKINIGIMRAFIELRKIASIHKELFERVDKLETGFDDLKNLVKALLVQSTTPKNKIGFYLDP